MSLNSDVSLSGSWITGSAIFSLLGTLVFIVTSVVIMFALLEVVKELKEINKNLSNLKHK